MNEVSNRTDRPEIQSQSDSDETPKTKLEPYTVIIDSVVWETSRGYQVRGIPDGSQSVEFVVKSLLFSVEMYDEIFELLEKKFVTRIWNLTPVCYVVDGWRKVIRSPTQSLDVLRMKEEVSV